jgi:hypothetical protein
VDNGLRSDITPGDDASAFGQNHSSPVALCVDMSRSKRSRRLAPLSPPPPPKHAKYDHAPTDSQQPGHSPGDLLTLNLRALPLGSLSGEDAQLDMIFNSVTYHITTHILTHRMEGFDGKKLTKDLSQFKEIIKPQQSQFFEVFRKAADPSANDGDRRALLKHGMCFCYGINLVTIIF